MQQTQLPLPGTRCERCGRPVAEARAEVPVRDCADCQRLLFDLPPAQRALRLVDATRLATPLVVFRPKGGGDQFPMQTTDGRLGFTFVGPLALADLLAAAPGLLLELAARLTETQALVRKLKAEPELEGVEGASHFLGAKGLARVEAAVAARPAPHPGTDLVRVLEGVVIECLDPTGSPMPDAVEGLVLARQLKAHLKRLRQLSRALVKALARDRRDDSPMIDSCVEQLDQEIGPDLVEKRSET